MSTEEDEGDMDGGEDNFGIEGFCGFMTGLEMDSIAFEFNGGFGEVSAITSEEGRLRSCPFKNYTGLILQYTNFDSQQTSMAVSEKSNSPPLNSQEGRLRSYLCETTRA